MINFKNLNHHYHYMVNEAFKPGDFENFPFADMARTVVRTPVTTSTDSRGDESVSEGSSGNITAIFAQIPRNSREWEKIGYTLSADALIMVLPSQDLELNDIITVEGRDYRCGQPTTRAPFGFDYYKEAQLFVIDE